MGGNMKSVYGVEASRSNLLSSGRQRSSVRAPQQRQVGQNLIAHKTPITGTKSVYATNVSVGYTGAMMPKRVTKQAAPAPMLLLPSEKEKYGDRCPKGFKKISLLGKGGIALVWLAEVKGEHNQG